jgi:WD40 repeat protein
MTEFGNIRRRQFVAIATAKYEEASLPELCVDKEVRIVGDWLTKPGLRDRRFTRVHEELASNPAKGQVEDLFEDSPGQDLWDGRTAAVVYITGHGVLKDRGEDSAEGYRNEHYLVLEKTRRRRLARTGIATATLFEWLSETDIEYLCVIIDTCFAGQVTEQVKALARDHWLILPGAERRQEAKLGALAEAISEYLRTGQEFNTHDPYLKVGMFVDALNDILPSNQKINEIYKGLGTGDPDYHPDSDPHVCLPNPNYQQRDELVETAPARRALALRKDLLELHQRRARRTSPGQRARRLFTGREVLMRELIDATGQPGVTLITGSAGSGKSTALSRLVTLSDPTFREQYPAYLTGVPGDMLPELNSVDVAVSARELSPRQVVAQICHHLGLRLKAGSWRDPVKANRDALSGYLTGRRVPTTIVLDAFDEAKGRAALVDEVLDPLRQENPERLCLLVGVRSPGRDDRASDRASVAGESLADWVAVKLQARQIQVDDHLRWNQDDFITYICNILRNTKDSPYRNARTTAITAVAKVIGELAKPSYLLAGTAAEAAAKLRDITSPNDSALIDALKGGLPGVFRKDLKDSFPLVSEQRLGVILLRAVAFARGNGLPWRRVWPNVAEAVDLDGGQYGDRDVEWLLNSRLNAYLVTDREDDLTVYRLRHEELRQTLRDRWRELLDENVTQQADEAEIRTIDARIARKLRAQAEDVRATVGVDQVPPPYVRRYLTEHALAGGLLDGGFVPVRFLPYLDLARLRTGLAISRDPHRAGQDLPWLPAVRQITHLWNWNRPAQNAAAIEMWAALTGTLLGEAEDPGPVGGRWRVRWAVRPPDASNVLGEHEVRAAAAAELGDGPVVVTGGMDGKLRIWDPSRGTRYGEPIDTHGGAVWSITTARLPGGTTVAITGGQDGLVRIWDLEAGRALGDPVGGGNGAIESVTAALLPGGPTVVAASDSSGTVRAWDLASRGPVGAPLRCGPGLARGLTTAVLGGQVLGLATGRDGGLQIWDLATGSPVCDRLSHPHLVVPLTGSPPGGRVIGTARLDQREVVITGNDDGLLMWDLPSCEPAGERLTGGDGTIRSISTVLLGDHVIAVTGGNGAVQVWDLSAGQQIGGLLAGHLGSVEAVCLAQSAGGVLAVSGSRDKTVRSWEVPGEALSAAGPLAQQIGTVQAVATARRPDGRTIAVTCDRTQVQVWDLEAGGEAQILTGHDSPVRCVAATELADGEGVLVAAVGWDGTIITWSAGGGTQTGRGQIGDLGDITSIAAATVAGGRAVALAGDMRGGVRIWDLRGNAPAGVLPDRHVDAVVAVTTATTTDGRTLVISGSMDGCIRIRDLDAHLNPGLPPLYQPVEAATVQVASLAAGLLPDGQACVVVGGGDGTVRLLDVRGGAMIGKEWQACSGAVAAVAAGRRPDGGAVIFTSGEDSLVQAWEPRTGEPVGEGLPTPGPVQAMTFQPLAASLVIGGTGVAVACPRRDERD